MNDAYLLCEGVGVDICSLVGEAEELVFDFRAQQSDGGQSDVCVVKVLLDLLCVLCVTNRHISTCV